MANQRAAIGANSASPPRAEVPTRKNAYVEMPATNNPMATTTAPSGNAEPDGASGSTGRPGSGTGASSDDDGTAR